MRAGSVYADIPAASPEEVCEVLAAAVDWKLVRIVSLGHATPAGTWYDQDEDEWVMVLRGRARLFVEGETETRVMKPGDWVEIPAHRRHRVAWTDPSEPTIWLALHYRPPSPTGG